MLPSLLNKGKECGWGTKTGDLNRATCRPLLEAELEAVGIRLNQSFPNVSFKIKKAGGISFNATLKLTKVDQKMVHNILHDYSMCGQSVCE